MIRVGARMRPSEEKLEAKPPIRVREEEVFLFILKRKRKIEITVGSINGK